MPQRFAAFLLGCWILGSLFMMFAATQNFQAADRVLNSAQAQPAIQSAGNEQARALLRTMAGEANQSLFVTWEIAQITIGVALGGILLFGAKNQLLAGLAGAFVLLAVYQHFQVTPEMISLTAQLDSSAAESKFLQLHALYGGIEVVKLLMALVIAGFLLPGWRARSRNPIEMEAVR